MTETLSLHEIARKHFFPQKPRLSAVFAAAARGQWREALDKVMDWGSYLCLARIFNFKFEVSGLENLRGAPKDKPLIIYGNHQYAIPDIIAMFSILTSEGITAKAVAQPRLKIVPLARQYMIPLDHLITKDPEEKKKLAAAAHAKVGEMLQNNGRFVIFPSGGKVIPGPANDLMSREAKWFPGIGRYATGSVTGNKPVAALPVYFEMPDVKKIIRQNFFTGAWQWAWKFRSSTVNVKIGEIIPPQEIAANSNDCHDAATAGDYLRARLTALASPSPS